LIVSKPDEELQTWREDTRSGFIAFLVLAVPFLGLISLAPTLYHIFAKMRARRTAMKDGQFLTS
jgi:hypothetical protein